MRLYYMSLFLYMLAVADENLNKRVYINKIAFCFWRYVLVYLYTVHTSIAQMSGCQEFKKLFYHLNYICILNLYITHVEFINIFLS